MMLCIYNRLQPTATTITYGNLASSFEEQDTQIKLMVVVPHTANKHIIKGLNTVAVGSLQELLPINDS